MRVCKRREGSPLDYTPGRRLPFTPSLPPSEADEGDEKNLALFCLTAVVVTRGARREETAYITEMIDDAPLAELSIRTHLWSSWNAES